MTNQQGAEALAHELYTAAQLAPGEGVLDAVARLAALVEAQQPEAHVQNHAEIEHVAGDVSKNGAESNMAQQPAPRAPRQAARSTDQVEEILRERDDAEDFIDALLDEVLGHERPEWSSAYGRADALNDVRERMTALHKPAVDKAWDQFQSAMEAPQQPAPSAAAEVENLRKALQFYADKDHFNIADDGAWDTVSGEPQNYWCDEEGTATVEDGAIARLALAGHQIKFDADEAPQPSPTPQADSQPAPVRDERDDFEKVFPLPSGCIRVGTGYASTGYSNWAAHTHCERWQGWQARAARAPADSVLEDAARVFTYKNQPGNVEAWRFGEACRAAQPGGDPIDHGLSLLQKLQERGYGIVAIDAARKQGGAT